MLLASAIPPFAGSAPANIFAAGPASDSMRPGTPQGITQPGRGEFDQVSPYDIPLCFYPPRTPFKHAPVLWKGAAVLRLAVFSLNRVYLAMDARGA